MFPERPTLTCRLVVDWHSVASLLYVCTCGRSCCNAVNMNSDIPLQVGAGRVQDKEGE